MLRRPRARIRRARERAAVALTVCTLGLGLNSALAHEAEEQSVGQAAAPAQSTESASDAKGSAEGNPDASPTEGPTSPPTEASTTEAETPGDASPPSSASSPAVPDEALEEELSRAHQQRETWRRANIARSLPQRAEALSLTISGGVSLGSFESGLVHTLTEALRRSPGSARLRVATGASAGSANALVSAIEACEREIAEPEESLGYQVWVSVGLQGLFDPDRVTESSVFVRDPLERSLGAVQRALRELPPECEFVFGLSTTRESGYEVELAPDLVVPRLTERFAVHVVGRKEQVPAFFNYLDPARSYERPLLPLSHGRDPTAERDFAAISQILKASAGFPIAFPTQEVEHCITAPREGGSPRELDGAAEARGDGAGAVGADATEPPRCDRPTRVDQFLDGGLFDNNPLGLAQTIVSQGLRPQPHPEAFRPVPDAPDGSPLPEVVYGYVDPWIRTYPEASLAPAEDLKPSGDPLLRLLMRVGGQALQSARGQELASLAERNPSALERLWLIESSYPQVSELLGAFFGFFERDFRDFDFHLGSYESYRDLRDHSGTMLGVDPFLTEMELTLSGPVEDIPARYKKLGCILAHVEPDEYARLEPLCSGKGMRNFRILLQVTIDRLWSNCRWLTDDQDEQHEHLQCKRAHGQMPPPVVDPTLTVRGPHRFRRRAESDLDYTLRLLGDYGFAYRDLQLPRDKAHLGRRAVRRRLEEMARAIATAQPGIVDRTVVLTAGRMAVNSVYYEPPRHRATVLLGSSLAVGYLGRLGRGPAFYFNVDGRINHLRSLITDEADQFAGTLSAGVEMALLPLSGRFVQTSLGLRGGYRFAADDAIGIQQCLEEDVRSDPRSCSQPVIHGTVNIALLERVRLQAVPLFFPLKQPFGHKLFDIELGVGAEFF